jgi:hypothetical protein
MATQFSGGTYVNQTFTGDTIANIISNLQSNLTSAGWSVISGGGTTNVLMESATQTNVTNPVRVRLKTTGANCAGVTIENHAGTLAGVIGTGAMQGGMLLPAVSKTFRVIATRYHFLALAPGSTAARDFVMAGMPYVDPALAGVADIGYMMSNCQSDSSTTGYASFRSSASMNGAPGSYTLLYNASLWSNYSTGNGSVETLITTIGPGASSTAARHYRWANDDLLTSDVLLSWGLTSYTDEGKIRGQALDMIYISDAIAMDTTMTYNGHTWYNLTNNGTQSASQPRGGIWVAVS